MISDASEKLSQGSNDEIFAETNPRAISIGAYLHLMQSPHKEVREFAEEHKPTELKIAGAALDADALDSFTLSED